MFIEEAARDLGTVLTLREWGTGEVDPRPSLDDELGSKIPPRTLEPEETKLEEIPLNKACPKDFYPLPRIDQLVDSTAGHDSVAWIPFQDTIKYSWTHVTKRKRHSFA